jgi:hypothetical protein
MQSAGEIDDAGFIGNAEQSAANGRSGGCVHAGVRGLGEMGVLAMLPGLARYYTGWIGRCAESYAFMMSAANENI